MGSQIMPQYKRAKFGQICEVQEMPDYARILLKKGLKFCQKMPDFLKFSQSDRYFFLQPRVSKLCHLATLPLPKILKRL